MGKKIIITEEEKKDIKSLYNISEQRVDKIIPKSTNSQLFDIAKMYGDKSKSLFPANVLNKTTPDDDIFKSVLSCIGAKPTKDNMIFMYAWRQTEHSLYHKKIPANNNPFHTTLKMPGAKSINKDGVKDYVSLEQGIDATCKTLKESRYSAIVSAFRNNEGVDKLQECLKNSPWGTDMDLFTDVINGYLDGYEPKLKPIPRT
jgi:hypothetical protein